MKNKHNLSTKTFKFLVTLCLYYGSLHGIALAGSVADAAREIIEARTLALHERVEGVLGESHVALVSASNHVAGGMEKGEAIAHASLKRLVELTRGLRAILAINADGHIIADSYNSPPPGVNLAKRIYFQEAKKPGAYFAIYDTVIGKTSGVPFVPLGLPRFGLSDVFQGVMVGILHPDRLISSLPLCRDCVLAVVLMDEDPKPLISRPSGLLIPKDLIIDILKSSENKGVWRRKLGTLPVIVGWHRSTRFGLVSIYARPEPDAQGISYD